MSITDGLIFAIPGAVCLCAASAIAAPLLTTATAAIPSIAMSVSTLQGQIFCGGYEFLTTLTRPWQKAVSNFIQKSLDIDDKNTGRFGNYITATNVNMAVSAIFQGFVLGTLLIGTSTLAPTLTIPFATGIATLIASRIVVGVFSVSALLAFRSYVFLRDAKPM